MHNSDIIVLNIPELPISRNQLDSKHWAVRRAVKQNWERTVMYAVKQAKVKPIKGAVDVKMLFRFADNRRHDPHDNYSHKGTFDALVKMGILEDDNYRIIRKVTTQGQKSDVNELVMVIEKVGDK